MVMCPFIIFTVAPHLSPQVSHNLLCIMNCTVRFGGQELKVHHSGDGEQHCGALTTWYTVPYCTL